MVANSTSSRFPSVSRRLRLPTRGAWLGARATNVLRRPRRLITPGILSFVAMLGMYLLLPRGFTGLRSLVAPQPTHSIDTSTAVERAGRARTVLRRAEDSLAARQQEVLIAMAANAGRARNLVVTGRRDSLTQAMVVLEAQLERTVVAPLMASYRSLGESPWLRSDPVVTALLDSLTDVEAERDQLAGGTTVDPVYIALTTRANELGRMLRTRGETVLARLRQDASQLPVSPAVSAGFVAPPDTTAPRVARDAAVRELALAESALAVVRRASAAQDSLLATQRQASQLAPLPLLAIAAAVVAFAAAFAFGLVDEARSPRVADVAEAERLSGMRVLSVVRHRTIPAERSRRAADRALPAVLDPTSDAYRMLSWHLTSAPMRDGVVSITGDDATVTALVASNLAAVLAADARATLLVDTDFTRDSVRALLELPGSVGLAGVLENKRKWSELLIPVAVARAHLLDVLPSGVRTRPIGPSEGDALVGELLRAARRHDITVVSAPLALLQQVRAGDDVVICAVRGETRLSALGRAVATLVDRGARVRGLVLWEGSPPRLPVVA